MAPDSVTWETQEADPMTRSSVKVSGLFLVVAASMTCLGVASAQATSPRNIPIIHRFIRRQAAKNPLRPCPYRKL